MASNESETSLDLSPKQYAQSKHFARKIAKKCVRLTQARKNNHKNIPPKKEKGSHTLILDAQAGFENLLASKGVDFSDSVVSWCEDLTALYIALSDCRTTKQFVAICTLFIKRHMSGSILRATLDYLNDIVGDLDPQDSLETSSPLLEAFRQFKTNWVMIAKSDVFSRISKLISMAISIGLCKLSDVQFTIAGVRAFSISVKDKQVSAVDFFTCLVETTAYFIEGGVQCFKAGSLRPFFLGDAEVARFEDDVALCYEYFELAKTGNLEKTKGISDNDFEHFLSDVEERCNAYCKAARPGTEKNLLLRQRERLMNCATHFRQVKLEGGLRVAPYAIGIFGPSGVGKSSVAQILMALTLAANDFKADDDRIITLNEGDKFMSNYKSHVNGIFIDDLGNTKTEFVERSPAQKYIEIINNVRAYAPMAEAELKGKVSIEPKVVVITRNVKDSFAHNYSNEPVSIMRREKVTLTVRVRDRFATNDMLDSEKVRAHYCDDIPVIPDLWEIDVERAYPVKSTVVGKTDGVGWEYVKLGGHELKGASLQSVIRFIKEDSHSHFGNQTRLVDQMKDIASKLCVCSKCKFPEQMCKCVLEEHNGFDDLPDFDMSVLDACLPLDQPPFATRPSNFENFRDNVTSGVSRAGRFAHSYGDDVLAETAVRYRQARESPARASEAIDRSIKRTRSSLHETLSRSKNIVTSYSDEVLASTAVHYRQLREFDTTWITVLNCLPSFFIESWVGKSYLEWHNYPMYVQHYEKVCKRFKYGCGLLVIASCYDCRFLVILVFFALYCLRSVLSYREYLLQRVLHSRAMVPTVFKNFRDNQAKYLIGSCAALAGVYTFIKMYRFYKALSPQGNLSPDTMEEIEKRDSEQNPWVGADVTPLHVTEKSKCITHARLEQLVSNNLCHMSYSYNGISAFCNAFFPCSNVALIPAHIWRADEITAVFSRKGNKVIGGFFRALLSKSFTYFIPNSDLCLTWVPNGGSWRDLTDYLPIGNLRAAPCSMVYKGEDGTIATAHAMATPGIVITHHTTYSGLKYMLTKNTFQGLCMAPLISQTKAPTIFGFHLAGKADTQRGAAGILSRPQLKEALAELASKPGVLLTKNLGTMPTERYDVQFFESPEIHHKSPVRFLPPGANIEMYGSVKGRATYHSEVVPTPISPIVERICGVPSKWGKPQFHHWKSWQVSLEHSCKPSPGMPGNLLSVAVDDYKHGFLRKLRSIPRIMEQTVPLNRMETVCGIDGRRFVDKMPGRTSMGYPLGGPKNDHLTILDPDEHPSHACPLELKEIFWLEAEKMKETFRSGERAYPIFKGCLKDEPTLVTKDKVRVFQSAPIELQLLVRMYFLPVARLLSVFPLVSECAVGINAQGPEWETFTQHITKFGNDRIFAGDYSKYDLRMPSQLVLAAFRILIDVARDCGYTPDDIVVMEGIATEIAYPLMAYNGDLVQLFGSNPSGQNLTVFINGLVNSLLVRCYLADSGYLPKYKARDIISFLTYGDDIKGSAKPGFNISIKDYAAFLSKFDMKFTMPDKDSELVDLMCDADADFLKRKNVFMPEVGMHLGALDEDSIFKSLHSVLKSPAVSLTEQCTMNIDGALREWFAHGRDIYETRRAQMQKVADEAGISHGCSGLSLSFDDRITIFEEKYKIEHE